MRGHWPDGGFCGAVHAGAGARKIGAQAIDKPRLSAERNLEAPAGTGSAPKAASAWVAGEASADRLGAELLGELRQRLPQLSAVGIGGDALQAHGLHSLFEADRLAVMGLVEPVFRLPELLRMRQRLGDFLLQQRPDIFVGVDAPDFNLTLEERLHQANIPVIHYVSPSVWAWRRSRLKQIHRAVDCMFCLFPFELKIYQESGLRAHCIGHPMARACPLKPPANQRSLARKALGLSAKQTVIALMPGSRQSEVRYNLPVMLRTARQLAESLPDGARFVLCAASPARRQQIEQGMKDVLTPGDMEQFSVCDDSRQLLAATDVALVVMGTVTLEAMLYRVPTVAMYRTGPVNYHLLTTLIHLDMYSLPNLLAGERLMPEILQRQATPARLSAELLRLLDGDQTALLSRFAELHEQLLGEGVERAAEVVCEYAGW